MDDDFEWCTRHFPPPHTHFLPAAHHSRSVAVLDGETTVYGTATSLIAATKLECTEFYHVAGVRLCDYRKRFDWDSSHVLMGSGLRSASS